MKLIAFTGLKGSGKDTAASAFVQAGYEHVKMAGALKAMLAEMMRYQGAAEWQIAECLEGQLKERSTTFFGGRTPRHAMQTLGTEWGRNLIAPDIWTEMTARRCALFEKVVISDVRFPNEADMVHQLGGVLIRLDRGGQPDPHISEAFIQVLPVDYTVFNDFGSPDCLRAYMRARFLSGE